MIELDDYHKISTFCPFDISDQWMKLWNIDQNYASSLYRTYEDVFLGKTVMSDGLDYDDIIVDLRNQLHSIDLDTLEEDARAWYANVG